MYSYSPIKSIYIKNFRNLGEVKLDFKDSPIISLVGENEAGKTSVVKAFGVCALHATPRDQKDFIRDGTGGFGVGIELEDGTQVVRMKTTTFNKYTVQKGDEIIWEANKIDSGLPVAVSKVMGLIEEPETREFLQIRTYEDQLLFVVTPASTNYKVMYDALKVDQLTKAIKLGSKEANKLKSDIDNNEYGIATLTDNLRGIKIYDIEPLLKIRDRLSKELDIVNKLDRLVQLSNEIDSKRNTLGALAELSNTQEIDEGEVRKLERLGQTLESKESLMSRISRLSELDSLSEIDYHDYTKLLSIKQRYDSLSAAISKAGAYIDIGNADEVNEVELIKLVNISNLSRSIAYQRERLSRIDDTGANLIEQSDFNIYLKCDEVVRRIQHGKNLMASETQINNYCNQVEQYIKSLGVDVELCPKCGESIIVDIAKYTGEA